MSDPNGTSGTGRCPIDLADLPVGTDRGAGWRQLRDEGAVVPLTDSTLAVTSRAAVEYALRHPELFSSRLAFESLGSPLPLIPIAVDPPEHVRYRRILDPFFGPRRLAGLEPVLRAQVVEIIEPLRVERRVRRRRRPRDPVSHPGVPHAVRAPSGGP